MTSILARYRALVAAGELRPDAEQAAAAARLDALQQDLEAPAPAPGLFGKLFGARPAPRPRGMYMWGGVGRGKSMLMD
ncbi:MAG: AFG1/ZapE family ATPase, partial [Novosphingobium sp.]